MVILQNIPFVRCMRLKAENIFIYLYIPSGALHIYVYISAFFSSAESFMIDDRWSNTTMDVCRWPTDAGAAMGICRISSIVFYAFFPLSCSLLACTFFYYYYYFNVCKQASIIDEAPFLCRHELMYVFMYDISQMSRCAVYICRRLSIPIIRFVFQDPGETKQGRGGGGKERCCLLFSWTKTPPCAITTISYYDLLLLTVLSINNAELKIIQCFYSAIALFTSRTQTVSLKDDHLFM